MENKEQSESNNLVEKITVDLGNGNVVIHYPIWDKVWKDLKRQETKKESISK